MCTAEEGDNVLLSAESFTKASSDGARNAFGLKVPRGSGLNALGGVSETLPFFWTCIRVISFMVRASRKMYMLLALGKACGDRMTSFDYFTPFISCLQVLCAPMVLRGLQSI